MKLLFCIFKYFPYGGLQREFVNIAQACAAMGHEVHLITQSWQGDKPDALPVQLIPSKTWRRSARYRAFAQQVAQLKQNQHFDAVIGFNKIPGLDVYYAGDGCFAAKMSERHWLERLSPRCRVLMQQEASVFGRTEPTQILSLSEVAKQHYQQHYQTPDARFHPIPPSIDKTRAASAHSLDRRMRLRSTENWGQGDCILLMVGSGFKTKGVDRSLRALAEIKATFKHPIKLAIVGQDNPEPFKKLAKALHLESEVTFYAGRSDIPDFLAAADLLLHPAYHELAGMVLIEAMIAGLPVLCTENCGYSHYVEAAQAGRVMSTPFEPSTFAQHIVAMLQSTDYRLWQHNGIRFGQTEQLYNGAEVAAQTIETLCARC